MYDSVLLRVFSLRRYFVQMQTHAVMGVALREDIDDGSATRSIVTCVVATVNHVREYVV